MHLAATDLVELAGSPRTRVERAAEALHVRVVLDGDVLALYAPRGTRFASTGTRVVEYQYVPGHGTRRDFFMDVLDDLEYGLEEDD